MSNSPQNPFFGSPGLLGPSPFSMRRPPYQLGAGPEGYFPPPMAPPEMPAPQGAGQREMSIEDRIAAAMQQGERFVPQPETNPMYPSGSPLAQSHPRIAAFLGNFMQGVAAGDPQGTLATMLAQRRGEQQAQAALPAQRLEAGMGLSDWFEKMRAGRETSQMARERQDLAATMGQSTRDVNAAQIEELRRRVPAKPPGQWIKDAQGTPVYVEAPIGGGVPNLPGGFKPEPKSITPHIAQETRAGRTYDVAYDRSSGKELWAVPSDPTAYQTSSLGLQQQRLTQANQIQQEVLNIRKAQLANKGLTPTELGSLSTSLDRITNMQFLLADDPEMVQTLGALQQMIRSMISEEEQKRQAAPSGMTAAPAPPTQKESSLGFTP